MCEQCVAVARKHYPDVPDDDLGSFLLAATAFPFGSPATVERQLQEHMAAGAVTAGAAIARAHQMVEQEMEWRDKMSAFPGWGWGPSI